MRRLRQAARWTVALLLPDAPTTARRVGSSLAPARALRRLPSEQPSEVLAPPHPPSFPAAYRKSIRKVWELTGYRESESDRYMFARTACTESVLQQHKQLNDQLVRERVAPAIAEVRAELERLWCEAQRRRRFTPSLEHRLPSLLPACCGASPPLFLPYTTAGGTSSPRPKTARTLSTDRGSPPGPPARPPVAQRRNQEQQHYAHKRACAFARACRSLTDAENREAAPLGP